MAVFPSGVNVKIVASKKAEWLVTLSAVAGEQKKLLSSAEYNDDTMRTIP